MITPNGRFILYIRDGAGFLRTISQFDTDTEARAHFDARVDQTDVVEAFIWDDLTRQRTDLDLAGLHP